MRAALERYAGGATGAAIAIRALTEVDGHSPFVRETRELWKASGAYGHTRAPSRKTERRAELAEPVDPDYERHARREFGWALREAWRTIWAECGAPITVIRIGQNGRREAA